MKNFSFIIALLLPLTLLCQEIAPGITYFHHEQTAPFALSYHALTVDPAKAEIALCASHDICHSAQTTSAMAERTKAIAAINGSFFDFCVASKLRHFLIRFLDLFGYNKYDAFPIWAMKIKNEWFATAARSMAMLAWHEGGKKAAILNATCAGSVRITGDSLPVATFNKPFSPTPVLYTPVYGAATPVDPSLWEIVVKDGTVIDLKIAGNTVVPNNGFVYAFDPEQIDGEKYENGVPAEMVIALQSPETHELLPQTHWDYIRASIPLLVQNNQLPSFLFEQTNEFYCNRHPRTAVGLKENGQWVFLVVDGRQSHSAGMTLLELAELMAQLGCKDALNLGGGGDSTMVINNTMVNSPSGRTYAVVKKERPIADGIMVFPRNR